MNIARICAVFVVAILLFGLASALEEDFFLEGIVEVVIIDSADGTHGETEFYLHGEKSSMQVYFEGDVFPASGDVIRAEGYTDNGILVVVDYEVLESASSLRDFGALGEQRVAVVLLNFQDDMAEPMTLEEVRNRYFNESRINTPNHWINEVSYGQAWLDGDVYGWITLPLNRSQQYCGLSGLRNAAMPHIDSYINFANYKIISFIQPDGYCNFGGVANIGTFPWGTQDGTLLLTFNSVDGLSRIEDGTMSHEIGHNLGLLHANNFECWSVSLGNNCQSYEYGGIFDIMIN